MAYSHIREKHGLDLHPGQLVIVTQHNGERVYGTVARPGHGKDPHFVRVKVGSVGKPLRVDPSKVEVIA